MTVCAAKVLGRVAGSGPQLLQVRTETVSKTTRQPVETRSQVSAEAGGIIIMREFGGLDYAHEQGGGSEPRDSEVRRGSSEGVRRSQLHYCREAFWLRPTDVDAYMFTREQQVMMKPEDTGHGSRANIDGLCCELDQISISRNCWA